MACSMVRMPPEPAPRRKRWRPRLMTEIAAILLLKIVVIVAFKFAFFGAETRVEVSPASVSRGLLERGPESSTPSSSPRSNE